MNGSPSIRCDDLTRELSAPSGRLDAEVIDRHLARCASCAEFARRAARFDDLWAATRPAAPADAFSTLWPAVMRDAAVAGDDRPATLAIPAEARAGRWRRGAIGGLLMAQAAAAAVVLLTVATLPERDRPAGDLPGALAEVADGPLTGSAAELAPFGDGKEPVEIEPSQLVVFRIQGVDAGEPRARLVRLDLDDYEVSDTETIALDLELMAYAETWEAE